MTKVQEFHTVNLIYLSIVGDLLKTFYFPFQSSELDYRQELMGRLYKFEPIVEIDSHFRQNHFLRHQQNVSSSSTCSTVHPCSFGGVQCYEGYQKDSYGESRLTLTLYLYCLMQPSFYSQNAYVNNIINFHQAKMRFILKRGEQRMFVSWKKFFFMNFALNHS